MKRRGNFKFLGKFSWYIPGTGGIFALLAWLLLGAAIGGILVVVMGAIAGPDSVTEYGTLLSYPIMFVPPMLFAAVKSNAASMSKGGFKLDSNNFAPLGGALCALIAAAGTLACAFWADCLVSFLPPMPQWFKDAMESMTNGNLWINLLCVSIMAPICEEWLCRGMVLRGMLARGAKPAVAIAVSALFFAFIHLNPWQAVPAFILGCLFGYVYYRTGSLKLTMLMHCVNNTFAVICSRIHGWEEMETWKDVVPGGLYWILVAATALLTVLAVLAFRKVTLVRGNCNCDPVPSIFDADEKEASAVA
ncbi:MAG: CPBP family intramembrane metalloprotease [Bacteroidales bacterium]|nr:CPBP family intramembrane metalloprotease [Bacteroidales bacterium]